MTRAAETDAENLYCLRYDNPATNTRICTVHHAPWDFTHNVCSHSRELAEALEARNVVDLKGNPSSD